MKRFDPEQVDKALEKFNAPAPVSPLYTVTGAMVRLWSNGWHCTACHKPECEHIEEGKRLWGAETGEGKNEAVG